MPQQIYDSVLGDQNKDQDDKFREFLARRRAARDELRRRRNRRAAATPLADALRYYSSNLNYATKAPGQEKPKPRYTNLQVCHRIKQKWGRCRIPNIKFEDHGNRVLTLYLLANSNPKAQYSLTGIDIDCCKALGIGTPEGCLEFAKWLSSQFAGLFVETSPGGLGIHCYYLLDKEDERRPDVLNDALAGFERWLRFQARSYSIEQVECKGTFPLLHSKDGELAITSGQYLSAPRSITVVDLARMERQAIKVSTLLELTLTPVESREIPRRQSGSGEVWPTAERQAGCDKLGEMLEAELGEVRLKSRHVVSAASWKGWFLCLLIHREAKLKVEGFSGNWAEGVWNAMWHAGVLDQAWNSHRWKFMRDWYSDHGQLFCESADFYFGEPGKGLAMVWEVSEEGYEALLGAIDTLNNQGGDTFRHNLFTSIIQKGCMPSFRPIRHSLEDLNRLKFIEYEQSTYEYAA